MLCVNFLITKIKIQEKKEIKSFLPIKCLNPPNQGFHCSALKALTPIFHV
eukprot:UN09217